MEAVVWTGLKPDGVAKVPTVYSKIVLFAAPTTNILVPSALNASPIGYPS